MDPGVAGLIGGLGVGILGIIGILVKKWLDKPAEKESQLAITSVALSEIASNSIEDLSRLVAVLKIEVRDAVAAEKSCLERLQLVESMLVAVEQRLQQESNK